MALPLENRRLAQEGLGRAAPATATAAQGLRGAQEGASPRAPESCRGSLAGLRPRGLVAAPQLAAALVVAARESPPRQS